MAELGIGVSLGVLQIADVVIRLTKMLNEMRSLPQDLNDVASELDLVSHFLDNLQQHSSIELSTIARAGNQQRCQTQFENYMKSLQEVIDGLKTTLKNHPHTGRLRALLRNDDFKRCKERLQRGQVTMSLALQEHYARDASRGRAALTDQLSAFSSRHNDQMTTILKSIDNIQTALQNSPSVAQVNRTGLPAAALIKETTPQARPLIKIAKKKRRLPQKPETRDQYTCKRQETSVYNFQLSLWNVRKCFQILWNKNKYSVGIHLRVYNARPNDSSLFTAANDGKWNIVRRMIAKGTASPFDVDEWGRTLLHYAASQANANICRYLLEQHRLEACYAAWNKGITPLESLALEFRRLQKDEPEERSSLDTMRLLLQHDCGDGLDDSKGMKRWSNGCSLPAASLRMLITAMECQYESIDPLLRARAAVSTKAFDPGSVNVILGPGLELGQAFKLFSKGPRSSYGHRKLLINASRCLARLTAAADPDGSRRTRWLSIVAAVVKFESENAILAEFRSMYANYIAHRLWSGNERHARSHGEDWNVVFTSCGREWLQIVVECGANLERYAKAEKALLHRQTFSEIIVGMNGRGYYHCHHIQFLLCGPKIEDWKIFVVPSEHVYNRAVRPGVKQSVVVGHQEYTMAGDFWSMIENPEVFGVPGSYPKEDQPNLTPGRPKKIKGPIF